MESKILRLRILTVSLKLKFRCRLRLQFPQSVTTKEYGENGDLFLIDEVVQFTPRTDVLDISVILISEKGSQYSGGTVKTTISQLRFSSGSIMKLPIMKCINKQAWVELQALVIPNFSEKQNRKELSFQQQRESDYHQPYTPDRTKKGNLVIQSNLAQTRSQHGLPQPISSFKVGHQSKKGFDSVRPNFGQFSNIKMQKNKEARTISPFQSTFKRSSPEQMHTIDEFTKDRQQEYSPSKIKKLKEKFKKEQQKTKQQQQKRKKIEQSEYNYKLEVVKLNISQQQKQKQLEKKDTKIKELDAELIKHKETNKKMEKLRQELKTKGAQIIHLQNQLDTVRLQLKQTKQQNQANINKNQEQNNQIRRQLEKNSCQKDQIIDNLSKKLKSKEDQVSLLNNKISKSEEIIEQEKKSKMSNDSRHLDIKAELQKNINQLKKQLKIAKQEYSINIMKLEGQKTQIFRQLTILKQDLQKSKIAVGKHLMEKRILDEKVEQYQQKILQMKRSYQKLNDEGVNKWKPSNQISKLKRKYQTAQQVNHRLEEKIKHIYQDNQQFEKKCRIKDNKIEELEGKIRGHEQNEKELKALLEKAKKNEDNLQRQYSQFRQKQKQLKGQLSRKDIENTKLKLQLQTANERLFQLKNQIPSRQFNQSQQWEGNKANGIFQVHKFLEIELANSKHSYSELEGKFNLCKEEIERLTKQQYEWRQQERSWQNQKMRFSAQISKLSRQNKQYIKKLAEEDAKSMLITQKNQKQRKLAKNLQQKLNNIELSLKKIADEKQQLAGELQIKDGKIKFLENQMVILRSELQIRESDTKKYKAASEANQSQNKRLKQEISDLTLRVKQEQQIAVSQSRKARQEMARYETRFANLKREGDKFKENLRSILIESILNQQQPKQQKQGISKGKQKKLAFTLTNQLLVRLEQHLKQLWKQKLQVEGKLKATQKQLIGSREEIILKTNQYQNTESQLKIKLDQLIENLQKMKQIYEERQQQLRKSIGQAQWHQALKENQIQRLTNDIKDLSQRSDSQLKIAQQNYAKKQKGFLFENEKMKARLADFNEKQVAYTDQINTLEDYITALEANISNYRIKQDQLEQQCQRVNKQLQQQKASTISITQKLQEVLKQKAEMKNSISVIQSQFKELKIVCDQYKIEIQALQKQKCDTSALVRNIMKEKQALLHQYLASEQKSFQFQTKIMDLQQKYQELKEQSQKQGNVVDQIKQQRKKSLKEIKLFESTLSKKQSDLREIQEKLKQKQKYINKLKDQNANLDTLYTQLKFKFESYNKNWESKSIELQDALAIKTTQIQKQQAINQIQSKQIAEFQGLIRKGKEKINDLEASIEQANLKHSQALQTIQRMQIQIFSCKSSLAQMKEDSQKLKQELQERDLANYKLSSDLYRTQTEATLKIQQLAQKIFQQEQSMIKYEQICEEYCNQIEQLKSKRQELHFLNQELQNKLNFISKGISKEGFEQTLQNYGKY